MEILIIISQLVLSLAILVVLHEFGHYLAARMFNIRVEKFYLFFDPWFSLFKRKIGDTEWGIGWLPLGGYVKISGMIDESMDKEQMALPPQPWEFRSKPAWQRLIVMIGGVTVNFVLALIIYAMILFVWGKQYYTVDSAEKYGMSVAYPEFKKYGLEDGDIPVEIGGKKIDNIAKIFTSIVIDGNREVTVKRGEENVVVNLPKDFDQIALKNGYSALYSLRVPAVVHKVIDKSNAKKGGLKDNDSIVAINGVLTPYYDNVVTALEENKNKKVTVEVIRNNETVALTIQVDSLGKIGFQTQDYTYFNIPYATEKFGFFESFPAGVSLGVETLSSYVKSMGLIFTKEGAKQVGGFGSMSKIFAPVWDWRVFWQATAFLSIVLAFMNILPIPALDGGHVVFLLYEIVTGKEAPQKVLEIAQYVGFFILIALMLYANGNDLFKFLTGK
ncbi:MAG: RIP metalloprotease RseP [Crocinitomicaceae bacterium]|nr:RIP metalloprotease RseP [Crocinitomicaceae bacterium]